MASKVMVGLTQNGFFPQGKRREEVINLGYVGSTATNPELKVKQLEQNIRFLQEQHQIMLSGLHREVEVLRRRNRDLQFQMVFAKGGVAVLEATPTASPDDDCPRTVTLSPGQVNITPLQIELLERDLAELRTNYGEAKTRNLYLQNVVDEQKKVIQSLEEGGSNMVAVGKKISPDSRKDPQVQDAADDSEEVLKDKLDEADRMVRRLRRENEEQRKEIVSLRSAVGRVMAERRNEGAIHRQHYPRNSQSQHSQTSRFPPLYPNNYWNNPKNSGDYHRDRAANRIPGREGDGPQTPNTSLPLLKDRNMGPSSSGYNNGGFSGHYGGNYRRGYPHSQRGNRSYRNHGRDPRPQD